MTTTGEQSLNIKATAWTVGVHALLLLLFLWISYSVPASVPTEELGMEVNLGTSEDGSGTDQPMAVDAPSSVSIAAANNPRASQNTDSRDMMRSDDPDAPAIAPTNTNTSNTRNNSTPTNTRNQNTQQPNNATTTRPQQPRYVYQGSNGPGGNNAATNRPGGSEGNTTGNGDRGVPSGTPGASNYTGSPGNGTGGINHTLSGRDISPRQFVAEFNEGGKVVIRVTVDRNGNIINKSIKSSPNKTLSNIALQKLSLAKFSANKDAAPQQFGEITIVFKSRS